MRVEPAPVGYDDIKVAINKPDSLHSLPRTPSMTLSLPRPQRQSIDQATISIRYDCTTLVYTRNLSRGGELYCITA